VGTLVIDKMGGYAEHVSSVPSAFASCENILGRTVGSAKDGILLPVFFEIIQRKGNEI
jgi:hypothetical protein